MNPLEVFLVPKERAVHLLVGEVEAHQRLRRRHEAGTVLIDFDDSRENRLLTVLDSGSEPVLALDQDEPVSIGARSNHDRIDLPDGGEALCKLLNVVVVRVGPPAMPARRGDFRYLDLSNLFVPFHVLASSTDRVSSTRGPSPLPILFGTGSGSIVSAIESCIRFVMARLDVVERLRSKGRLQDLFLRTVPVKLPLPTIHALKGLVLYWNANLLRDPLRPASGPPISSSHVVRVAVEAFLADPRIARRVNAGHRLIADLDMQTDDLGEHPAAGAQAARKAARLLYERRVRRRIERGKRRS